MSIEQKVYAMKTLVLAKKALKGLDKQLDDVTQAELRKIQRALDKLTDKVLA